tara:strand:- start:368 stop:1006 length:639 start_codon:yes stop_codon:yes gene_type:complete
MAVSSATTETKSKFGVPVTGQTGSGILMPKLKYRFRVSLLNNFGGNTETKVLTQNVQSVSRPKITYEEVMVESYNSRVYLQGKHAWEQITLTVRDDITNQVAKQVGAQVQRQLNHFQQSTPASGSDYKFDMQIEILDGVNAGASEVWFLEGCFLQNVDYSESDYSANDQVTVTMQIRYDNAVHFEGDNDVNGRTVSGNPFPDTVGTGTTTLG